MPARRVKPGQPAAELVRAAFEAAVGRMRAADPAARRGDVEGVHHLRTATRRLRSELRAVRLLVEPDWRKALECELKWLADLLGDVRDLDILTGRLREADPGGPASPLDPLFAAFRRRHRRASHQLHEALQGDRYRRLLAQLEASSQHPALTEEAARRCRKVLPPLAAEAWKKLSKDARKLDDPDPDAAFHEVRKLAKRARYTAELIAPALGTDTPKGAKRFIRLTTRLQDALGAHQDAIVAHAELERFLAEHHPAEPGLEREIRKLIRQQDRSADRAKEDFFELWPELDRKKSIRWMKRHSSAGS
jgi:CHAD domain-containing protein